MTSAVVSHATSPAKSHDTSQLTWPRLALLLLLPIAWWFIVLYVVSPLLMPFLSTPDGQMNGWGIMLLPTLGYLFEFFLALYIFHKEGYPLRWSALRERVHWRWPRGWKAWGLVSLLFVLGFGLSQLLQPLSLAIARVLPPPDWFPASQNPLKEVRSLEDALPGVAFQGNYLFLLAVLFSGAANIIGEDLYYRGALIPKLHGICGRWAWLAGGVIWPLKHLYVWWRLIADAGSLGIVGAYAFGPLGSLPVAMLMHFIGNFGITWPMIIQAVFSAS